MFFKNKFATIFLFCFITTNVHSIELIRDVELEEFTKETNSNKFIIKKHSQV